MHRNTDIVFTLVSKQAISISDFVGFCIYECRIFSAAPIKWLSFQCNYLLIICKLTKLVGLVWETFVTFGIAALNAMIMKYLFFYFHVHICPTNPIC
jgi:hypothetical protein